MPFSFVSVQKKHTVATSYVIWLRLWLGIRVRWVLVVLEWSKGGVRFRVRAWPRHLATPLEGSCNVL